MRPRATRATAFGFAVAFAVSAGIACGSDTATQGTVTQQVQAMPAAEQQRGRIACDKLAERTCACAAAHTDPELTKQCERARIQIDGLQLTLEIVGDTTVVGSDRAHAQDNARKIIAACLEAEARLDLRRCPRPPGPVAPGPPAGSPADPAEPAPGPTTVVE